MNNPTDKLTRLVQLLASLRMQINPGVNTWGPCPRCEKPAAGGNHCEHCIKEDILSLIPTEKAYHLLEDYRIHYITARCLERDLQELVDEVEV